MTLLQQFQSLVYSFLFSFFFCMIYAFYNRLVYRFRKYLLSYIVEILVAIISGLGYFYLLVKVNGGFFNLYMILCLVLGVVVFERWYAFYYLLYLEKIMGLLKKYFKPFYFLFKRIIGIMKHARKGMKIWQRKDLTQNQEI